MSIASIELSQRQTTRHASAPMRRPRWFPAGDRARYLPPADIAAPWPRSRPGHLSRIAKRTLDLALASLLLLVVTPLLLAAMLAIKLSSPGPVIFAQWRVGQNGLPFLCFKLRTMVDGADRLRETDQTLRAAFAASKNWKLANDPRVTRVGRVLRQTSIDELPQLVNVLLGDMSIVGPRPALPSEVDELFGPWKNVILEYRPGITGMWQVMGRASTSYKERALLDLRYVESQSVLQDLVLLLRTVPAVLTRRGAA